MKLGQSFVFGGSLARNLTWRFVKLALLAETLGEILAALLLLQTLEDAEAHWGIALLLTGACGLTQDAPEQAGCACALGLVR